MSKLLNGNNIDFLIGTKLSQLALGSYEFQLNVEAEISILIESSVRVNKEDGIEIDIQADNPEQTKELVFLLGKTVKAFQPSQALDLMLLFDDGTRITLSGSNGSYDAYTIWNKGEYVAIPAPPPPAT